MGKEPENGAVEVEPTTENGDEEIAPAPESEAARGIVPRRAPGQKEVIPFKWKVCGYSTDGCTLTFFRSVERADADAHLSRLQKEPYYSGLNVYGVDEPVPPAPVVRKPSAAKADKAGRGKAPKAGAAKPDAGGARKKPASEPAGRKKAALAEPAKAKKPAAARPVAKAKPPKKEAAGAKPARKPSKSRKT